MTSSRRHGFSTIELLITIFVGALFIITFNSLSLTITQSSAQNRWRSVANDIAYANLNQYSRDESNASYRFVCDSTTDLSTTYPNATGQILQSGTLDANAVGLPSPATYSIKALAVYGCSGANIGKPIRVESTVTYGPLNTIVSHAYFIGAYYD